MKLASYANLKELNDLADGIQGTIEDMNKKEYGERRLGNRMTQISFSFITGKDGQPIVFDYKKSGDMRVDKKNILNVLNNVSRQVDIISGPATAASYYLELSK